MSILKTISLNELAEEVTVGFVGPMASEYVQEGIPFLRSQNVVPFSIKTEGLKFISREFHQRLKKSALKPRDVVVVRTGTPGASAVIPETLPESNCADLVIIRCGTRLDPFFVSYFINSVNKTHVQAHLVGAVQQHFNVGAAKEIEIPLLSLAEQQAIAEVLRSLDDKVELLLRQNKTLEALAQTLFRQQFIEETEGGSDKTSLLSVIELVGGGTPKTDVEEYWNGNIKWISGKDTTPNHKKFIINTEKTIAEQGLANSSTRLLPKYSMIISARGTVGNYCLLSESMAFSQSNYGILPKFKDCYFFTYLLVANLVEQLKSAAYGSVFDTITTSTFREQQIKIPEERKVLKFELEVKPYFEKMLSNSHQVQILTQLRDTLLPKLMSGEVRVKA
jgi:type I restriction enzyme S subunit